MKKPIPLPEDQAMRHSVWDQMRGIALPDSRLHYDFAQMNPDFEGSERAAERACALPAIAKAKMVFTAPDSALTALREAVLTAGKTIIVSTYRMRRGFRMLDPAKIGAANFAFAATLDGIERFGLPIDLAVLGSLGDMDVLCSGASVISAEGKRFGRSYHYFDIEWGLLSELGLVRETTPILAFCHDVQIVEGSIAALPSEAVPDWIVTPSRSLAVTNRQRRPTRIDWDALDPREIDEMLALQELQRAKGLRR